MKEACTRCPLKDKSNEACCKRQCFYSSYVEPKAEEKKSYLPFKTGEIIDAGQFKLLITEIDEIHGDFNAQVRLLEDVSQEHGHFGSYVEEGKYYYFRLIGESISQIPQPFDSLTWEIPEEGTERFHREGHVGAQFILYWDRADGFVADLDS